MTARSRLLVLGLTLGLLHATTTDLSAQSGNWRLLEVDGTPPVARKHFVMVYDPINQRVILHGGETHADTGDVALDDVWALNLSGCPEWEQLSPTWDVMWAEPKGRHGHAGTYAPPASGGTYGRMLITGGRLAFEGPMETSHVKDTWELLLSPTPQWKRLAGQQQGNVESCSTVPGNKFVPRTHAAVSWLANSYYQFGGRGTNAMGDTWAHSGAAGTPWAHRSGFTGFEDTCGDTTPDRRYWHSLITDSSQNCLVTFGGFYLGPEDHSNTWTTQNGIHWTQVDDAPESYRRMFHTAIYDPVRARMVVLGGSLPADEAAPLSALTALALPVSQSSPWTTLSPTGIGPGAIKEHAAVYDSHRDRMIVFGGVMNSDGDLRDPDVWVLEFSPATLGGSKGKNTANITWTAPCGAASYDLRRSTSPITTANFSSAASIATDAPQAAGVAECATATGLSACTTYYYALRTTFTNGSISGISNAFSLTQNCSGGQVYCPPPNALTTPVVSDELALALGSHTAGRGAASIEWTIPGSAAGQPLSMRVYDVTGRRVATIESGRAEAGDHESHWAYVDDTGKNVSSGMYFIRLQVGSLERNLKLIVDPMR
jgi:hypothetical protein